MAGLFDGLGNLGNLQELLHLGQQMQSRMAELQENLGRQEVSATSGGGMVTAIVDGRAAVKGIRIDPSVVDPGDVEMLEDLVLAALVEAQGKARSMAEEEMRRAAGGLPLPVKLPGLF